MFVGLNCFLMLAQIGEVTADKVQRGCEFRLVLQFAPNPASYAPDKWTNNFFSTRSATIWGGTAQVQRNIVGERVLGLPKEPST